MAKIFYTVYKNLKIDKKDKKSAKQFRYYAKYFVNYRFTIMFFLFELYKIQNFKGNQISF